MMTDPHKIPTVQTIDWTDIRRRWQRGESAYSISKSLNGHPSRQWISRKASAEHWQDSAIGIVSDKHLNPPLRSPTKDTPAKRERVLEILAQGGTYRLAAKSVGVHETTLLAWRKDDSEFAKRCEQAQADFCMEQLGKVRQSKDTKDSRWLLAHHPITKADYQDNRHERSRLDITIRIPRHPNELATVGLLSACPANRLPAPVSASVSS